MNRTKLSLLSLAAAAIPAAGLVLAAAAGPNLLQNGDFSSGVSGWTNYGGNPQAVNGAMQLTNGYQGNGNSYYSALQCVTNIQEGVNYTARGDAYVELGQTPYGAAGIYLHFNTGPNCNGSNLGGGHVAAGFSDAQRGAWIPLTHSVTAPAGAKSVYIRPTALKEPNPYDSSVPETLVVLFDNLEFFETNGPAPDPAEDPAPDPAQDPAPEPVEDPAQEPTPDPVEEPTPDPVEEPTPDPMEEVTAPGEDPQPGEEQTPEQPQDQPEDTPEVPGTPEVPEVPQIPEIPQLPEMPEVPEVPETPAGDDPVVPEQPLPQQPAPEQPAPQLGAPESGTTLTPEVTVPLPPATGNGLVMTGRDAAPAALLALGASLAGLGSVAAAAAIRNRK